MCSSRHKVLPLALARSDSQGVNQSYRIGGWKHDVAALTITTTVSSCFKQNEIVKENICRTIAIDFHIRLETRPNGIMRLGRCRRMRETAASANNNAKTLQNQQ